MLNDCLQALPFVVQEPGFISSVAYSRATLPPFHFILQGETPAVFAHGWIAPHIGKAVFNPPHIPTEKIVEYQSYLAQTSRPDEIDALLHSAKAFMDGGVIEYVLLLMVIAAESATQRFIFKQLTADGVSKNKLDEAGKDITYSMMLNVLIWTATPDKLKPDRELIGKMNRARALRNDYMHEAKRPLDADEVGQLLALTRQYVSYLREVEKELVAQATGN